MCLSSSVLAEKAYRDVVRGWQSHEDVANWLEQNFEFDKERQKLVRSRLKSQGPKGLLVRSPDKLFEGKRGYCGDAANFAFDALNEISFDYNPQWVFIKNGAGGANHWVTAFHHEGDLYIMDFGAGEKWRPMEGVHGPYVSLDEYKEFLASLRIPNFRVEQVRFRDMPGSED